MGETCNHVAAAMYRVEDAVWIVLTNPACKTNAIECLPNRENIERKKIKDLDLSQEDFGQRGKKGLSVALSNRDFIHWKTVI